MNAPLGKNLESACKAYNHRNERERQRRQLDAAIKDVERFAVGSEEWKQAVRRNAEILSR